MIQFGLILDGTQRDGRRNALMAEKYQMCRRQTKEQQMRLGRKLRKG